MDQALAQGLGCLRRGLLGASQPSLRTLLTASSQPSYKVLR